MNHEELQNLLAPCAMETASAEERAALETHLAAGCNDCRRLLAGFDGAVRALPLLADPMSPPPRVKARLMARVGRRPRWAPLFAMAAGFLAAVGLGLWHANANKRITEAVLTVAAVEGSLLADGNPAAVGSRVPFGRRLTVPAGTADLRLASHAVFRLKKGSEIVVASQDKGFLVTLVKGAILSVVKTGTPYAVKTPVAVAAVRGTVFYVQADSDHQTSVCICHGRIHLDGEKFSRDLEGAHHNGLGLRTSAQGGLSAAAPAPLDHNDEEIAALQAIGF